MVAEMPFPETGGPVALGLEMIRDGVFVGMDSFGRSWEEDVLMRWRADASEISVALIVGKDDYEIGF